MNNDMKMFFGNQEPELHPFNDTIKQFCRELNEFLEEHERSVHDGERCDEERGNILAYILHCTGYDDLYEVMSMTVDALNFYRKLHDAGHSEA